MKYRDQKAARSGSWKWLSIEGIEYLFDLAADQRERANMARRAPEKLAEMRELYRSWEATVPAIPADAKASTVYSVTEIPRPAS